jgi:ankyrin repeat protein
MSQQQSSDEDDRIWGPEQAPIDTYQYVQEDPPEHDELGWLVSNKDANAARDLLARAPSFAYEDYHGKNLLHVAAATNDLATIAVVYSSAPDLVERLETRTGRYPLHHAARPEHLEALQLHHSTRAWLDAHPSLDGTNAKTWDINALRFLASKYPEALCHQDSEGYLPIHYASFASMPVLRLLSKNGWLLDRKTCHGNTCLHLVAEFGTSVNIEQVYRLCPDAALLRNTRNYLPLHCAALSRTGDPAGFDFLVNHRPELLLGNIKEIRECVARREEGWGGTRAAYNQHIDFAVERWSAFFGPSDPGIPHCYV